MHVDDGTVDQAGRPRREFVSASIVSSSYGQLFNSGGRGGYILDPQSTSIFCSWSVDGGTYQRHCPRTSNGGSCVPGCTAPAYRGDHPRWCGSKGGYCPFRPGDLRNMLDHFQQGGGQGYNEVIVRSDVWRRQPTATIEAAYGSAPRLAGVPRVRFNLQNRRAPFSAA